MKNNADILSMSDRGKSFLQHFGVKGMKWGVTRSQAGAAATVGKEAVKKAYQPSDDARKAAQYMTRAKLGGVKNLDNKEMQLVINRMQLERQYKELYGERQWTTKGAKWAKGFVNDVAKNAATSWLSNPFSSGKRRDPYRTQAWSNGQDFSRTINGSVGPMAIGN